MKKLLFVLPYYKIGGTLTAFTNLVNLIDKSRFSIDVFALTNQIDDYSLLPKGVNYIGLNGSINPDNSLINSVRYKFVSLFKSVKRLLTRLSFDPSDYVFKMMSHSLSGKYDYVIAFQEGQATRMAQYITSPHKIAWVHSIYSRFRNDAKNRSIYDKYDKIVCVSQTAMKDMVDCEPQWVNKLNVVYNALNKELLVEKANKKINIQKKINVVSVGRIDAVKRFSYIPEIAFTLKDSGVTFDWWIIGGKANSDEYDRLIAEIKKYRVSDCVHLTGPLSNPYPYIKSSDLLVCLSSSETFNYTIAEAKALATPVVTTDFPCAFEFIEHEKTGLILPLEKISNGILRMLNDKDLYNNIKQNLSIADTSSIVLNQFEKLFNNE